AHADPAAELPGVAMCLDARFTVRGTAGELSRAARALFRSYLATAFAPTELLTDVWFPPLLPGSGSAWIEFARRHGDYALVGGAAVGTLHGATAGAARPALAGGD